MRSIFGKYFIIMLTVIITSIIILGVMTLFLCARYFETTKMESLISNTEKAKEIIKDHTTIVQGEDLQLYETLQLKFQYFFETISQASNIDVYLYTVDGKFVTGASNGRKVNLSKALPQNMLIETLQNNKYEGLSNFDGVYKNENYVLCMPARGISGNVIGIVASSSSANGMNYFLSEIFRIFLVSSIFVIIISMFLIYFVTRRVVRPLKEMANISKCFSKGDFLKRVPVRSADEIGQLCISFNDMASNLSINEELRRNFIANVSHELKTPMTTIGGFVDGILDGTITAERQNHYLKIVSTEVKRLSRLVVSMLNIVKIEEGQLQIQPIEFPLLDVICNCLSMFEQKINDKKIQILGISDINYCVEGDRDLLHQVLYNLMDNAIKFSNVGGVIEFDVYDKENKIYVSIKNTGSGIKSEHLSKVFDRFYKADKSRSLDKNGVGLGLYIVKFIINMHNEEIFVTSQEGEYCTFTFSIKKCKVSKINKNKN